jgi:hypothetical protein
MKIKPVKYSAQLALKLEPQVRSIVEMMAERERQVLAMRPDNLKHDKLNGA